ncbi:uncharacterized protein TRUGW13939_06489 [Talaromyces rugulosus]|uniref:Uncharacterized protein n=1 Tax=Talaromyces rugulosus TaxID=121627 RepID=A0A7H8R0S4_TALRU|nr:uncharacterized protein TRUGW13939_06489 [Talaromyces rugulosus]QKX59355.1 hypothetical protein TRUGW13939_06489 [Talaromyces rugulosus]
MDLQEFLLYLHQCAYEVAKHLFTTNLAGRDRATLRLVSHTFNDIMLDYPILECLVISTHEEDLRYLETICENDKLLGRVSALIWNHDTHNFLSLYYGRSLVYRDVPVQFSFAELMDGLFLDQGRIDNTENLSTKQYLVRAKLANEQYINLMQNRDYKVMRKILPKLKRVIRINFSWDLYLASPSHSQWRAMCDSEQIDPILFQERLNNHWAYTNGLWFPEIWTNPILLQFLFPLSESEYDMLAHLAVRGIRFFESLWRQNTELPEDIRLR